ncbi:ATP-binding protein [Streptomyces sp. KR80]|uniref:ATP-binding protein n=1 Tax=Streptomyces sp. KR80 TaxID=3457426 RepID=UPI003FCF9A17
MTLDNRFTVPATPAGVPAARRTVAEILTGWGLSQESELAHVLRVAVSELVTNAVQHTAHITPHIAVTVQADSRRHLRIGVTDHHHDRPRVRQVAPEDTYGRGLALIRTLLLELGGLITTQRNADATKTVWIHLPAAFG